MPPPLHPVPSRTPAPADVTWTHVIYALHGAGVTLGIVTSAFVVTAFLFGLPSIVAVILNYVKRADVRGTYLDSHFSWQLRTFWFALLWLGGLPVLAAADARGRGVRDAVGRRDRDRLVGDLPCRARLGELVGGTGDVRLIRLQAQAPGPVSGLRASGSGLQAPGRSDLTRIAPADSFRIAHSATKIQPLAPATTVGGPGARASSS
jgi:uncharacterized membrane protein